MKKLFWKEWRENRLILFLGLAFIIVLRLLIPVLKDLPRISVDINLGGALALYISSFFALLFGASFFSGEFEKNNFPFLTTIPINPFKIYLTKFLTGVFFIALLIGLSLLLFLPGQANTSIWSISVMSKLIFFAFLIFVYLASIFAALIFRRTLTAVVFSPLIAAIALAFTFTVVSPLYLMCSHKYYLFLPLFLFLAVLFFTLTLFLWQREIVRKRKINKRVILQILTLFFLLFIIHGLFLLQSKKELKDEQVKLEKAGILSVKEEFFPSQIEESENAAPLYEKSFNLIRPSYPAIEKLFKNKCWTEEDLIEAKELVQKNREVISLIARAAQLKKCYFPIDYFSEWNPYSGKSWKLEIFAQLLAVHSLIQKDEGRTVEALKNCHLIFLLAKNSLDEPIFDYGMRYRIYYVGLTVLEEILAEKEIPLEIYALFVNELNGEEIRKWRVKSLKGGTYRFAEIFNRIRKGTSSLFPSWNRMERIGEKLYKTYLYRPLFNKDETSFLRNMRKMIFLADQPYYKISKKLYEIQRKTYDYHRKFNYFLFSKYVIQNFYGSVYITAEIEAWIEGGHLTLALKAYKTKYGSYPENLKQLVPGILPSLPLDPFTGKDFIYRKEGKGFIVYSVGRNLKDDGGVSSVKKRRSSDYYQSGRKDIVWRCKM